MSANAIFTSPKALPMPMNSVGYAQLVSNLRKNPMHSARTFTFREFQTNQFRSFEVKPKDSWESFIPETGIKRVDRYTQKLGKLFGLTKQSLIDLPKAAFYGGMYGAFTGFVLALGSWILFSRRFNAKYLALLFGVCAGVGTALGAIMNTVPEVFRKLKVLKDIIW